MSYLDELNALVAERRKVTGVSLPDDVYRPLLAYIGSYSIEVFRDDYNKPIQVEVHGDGPQPAQRYAAIALLDHVTEPPLVTMRSTPFYKLIERISTQAGAPPPTKKRLREDLKIRPSRGVLLAGLRRFEPQIRAELGVEATSVLDSQHRTVVFPLSALIAQTGFTLLRKD